MLLFFVIPYTNTSLLTSNVIVDGNLGVVELSSLQQVNAFRFV
ncbi:MAG: hypothetical protein N2314_08990 [Brevinematales bacterium]|nr:hypothetical protein [Brevinematales bacterium]